MTTNANPVEIYWISGSPYAWRALLAAEIKGIAYRSHLLQASEGEHKRAEYLALNPRGKVPVLRDGDVTVYESLAVMTYLDRRFPETPILGRSPREAGHIMQVMSEFASYLEPPIFHIVASVLFGPKLAAEPLAKYRSGMHTEFAWLDALAAKGAWLAGEAPSGADIVAYPFVKLMLRIGERPDARSHDLGLDDFQTRYARAAAWMQRVEGLPGYANAYPPHWKQAA